MKPRKNIPEIMAIAIDTPRMHLVNKLRELAKEAEKGEIVSFAGVCLERSGSVRSIRSGDYPKHLMAVVGMLEDLKLSILRLEEDNDEEAAKN